MDTDSEQGGDGNSAIMGTEVQDVGTAKGYVFLTVGEMDPNAQPKVELVGEVSDVAGNRQNTGKDNEADDRVAPSLTVSIMEGDRPVTNDKVTLTITSNENVGSPSVTYYMVSSGRRLSDAWHREERDSSLQVGHRVHRYHQAGLRTDCTPCTYRLRTPPAATLARRATRALPWTLTARPALS